MNADLRKSSTAFGTGLVHTMLRVRVVAFGGFDLLVRTVQDTTPGNVRFLLQYILYPFGFNTGPNLDFYPGLYPGHAPSLWSAGNYKPGYYTQCTILPGMVEGWQGDKFQAQEWWPDYSWIPIHRKHSIAFTPPAKLHYFDDPSLLDQATVQKKLLAEFQVPIHPLPTPRASSPGAGSRSRVARMVSTSQSKSATCWRSAVAAAVSIRGSTSSSRQRRPAGIRGWPAVRCPCSDCRPTLPAPSRPREPRTYRRRSTRLRP